LLHSSLVRFVGSATSGTDHVDSDYLRANEIGFVNSPGCNANLVKEYVVAALLAFAVRQGISLRGKTLGITARGEAGPPFGGAYRRMGKRAPLLIPRPLL